MIDIKNALYNILHSRYGRDVRQSIHDGIYQINENANEAVQTAKAMGVGTDVSSSTSSSTGYVAGNLYLNNSTWDLWQCIGTDSWVNKGNIKGETGVKGADGINYYIHIRYSDKYDGTGFTASPTASSEYMGVYYGTSQTAPTNKQDYQWTSYVGASGTSAYVHIMYSENADGTGFVSIPTPLCKYIGFYSGPLSSPPANKSYYTWSEYVGKSGTGSGDMTAAEYAPSGIYGKVDNAIKADNVGNAITAVLEKLSDVSGQLNYDGNPVGSDYINSVSNEFNVNNKKLSLANLITTKLSKVDDKIDKPSSAADGQVLTYNGTSNEWEAKNPSASITEPTDLEKGIIGGDEYNSTTTYAFDDTTKPNSCIKNNKIYTVKSNVTAFSNIEPTVTSGWEEYWEETSISKLKGAISSLEEKGNYEVIAEIVGTDNQNFNGIDLSKYSLIGLAMTYDKGILSCSTFPTKFLFERVSTNGYYAMNGADFAGINQISGNLTNASFNLNLNRSNNVYINFGALLFGVK